MFKNNLMSSKIVFVSGLLLTTFTGAVASGVNSHKFITVRNESNCTVSGEILYQSGETFPYQVNSWDYFHVQVDINYHFVSAITGYCDFTYEDFKPFQEKKGSHHYSFLIDGSTEHPRKDPLRIIALDKPCYFWCPSDSNK